VVANQGTDTYNLFPLASPVSVGANGTNFFVGAVITTSVGSGGIFPCREDGDFSQGKSWIAGDSSSTAAVPAISPTLSASTGLIVIDTIGGLAGNWMIRADPVVSNCYANCDHSTVLPFLNVADFTCFLQKFAAADPYANCDNSTQAPVLNVADFTCFLQKYAAGCSAP
jgi:hypothetical protein